MLILPPSTSRSTNPRHISRTKSADPQTKYATSFGAALTHWSRSIRPFFIFAGTSCCLVDLYAAVRRLARVQIIKKRNRIDRFITKKELYPPACIAVKLVFKYAPYRGKPAACADTHQRFRRLRIKCPVCFGNHERIALAERMQSPRILANLFYRNAQ